jgi:hypothetical protein
VKSAAVVAILKGRKRKKRERNVREGMERDE